MQMWRRKVPCEYECYFVMYKRKLSALINVGVAGGLKEDQNVLDIVISDKIVQADYDTSPIDGDDGIGLVFEADEKLKETCIEAAKRQKSPIMLEQ